MVNIITATEAIELIESTRPKGVTFTVEFTKKDGTQREMNARLAVKKGVTGVGMAYNPKEYGLIACYDMQKAKAVRKAQPELSDFDAAKKAYRMINSKTMTVLTTGGVTYRVVPTEDE